MLHVGDDDFVPGLEVSSPVALGDEIDALGRAANKDDLATVGRIDEALYLGSRLLVLFGSALAKPMNAAVDVGVVGGVKPADRVDDASGLVRGRGIVKINQPPAINLLPENRKVVSDAQGIELSRSGLTAARQNS